MDEETAPARVEPLRVALEDVEAARDAIREGAVRTPLAHLSWPDGAALSLGLPMAPSVLLQIVGPAVANHVLETLHVAYPDRFALSPTLAGYVEGTDDVVIRGDARRSIAEIRDAVLEAVAARAFGRLLLAGHAEDEVRAALPSALARMCSEVESRATELRPELCPAVPQLLAELKTAGKILGVTSGNLERIGWAKLRAAGIPAVGQSGWISNPRQSISMSNSGLSRCMV